MATRASIIIKTFLELWFADELEFNFDICGYYTVDKKSAQSRDSGGLWITSRSGLVFKNARNFLLKIRYARAVALAQCF